MAIPYDFPHELIGSPLIGKQRKEEQLYNVRFNFDGEAVKRQVRDNTTTYFQVSFLVPRIKLPLMKLWLDTKKNGQEFKINLQTEEGFNDYNAFWSEFPVNPKESDGYYTYSGELYCGIISESCGLTDSDRDCYYDYLMEGCDDALPVAVNENWPSE